jgi:hypothetical protein
LGLQVTVDEEAAAADFAAGMLQPLTGPSASVLLPGETAFSWMRIIVPAGMPGGT